MMLCIYNLHHNYAGQAGPPRAWPSAADRAAAGLASCCRRMRWGLWSQPRRVLTGTPSARQACLPGEEGGGVTPTVIRSRTFHCIHGPQGAPHNTRGRTAAAVRASRNGSRGAVHVARGAITSDAHVQRARFSRSSCRK